MTVQAKLIARSEVPELAKIAPYRDALIVEEYEVERVESGELSGKKARVARWGILGGKALSLTPEQRGGSVQLTLEPYKANPQLQSIYQSDTLEVDFETPFFYAVP